MVADFVARPALRRSNAGEELRLHLKEPGVRITRCMKPVESASSWLSEAQADGPRITRIRRVCTDSLSTAVFQITHPRLDRHNIEHVWIRVNPSNPRHRWSIRSSGRWTTDDTDSTGFERMAGQLQVSLPKTSVLNDRTMVDDSSDSHQPLHRLDQFLRVVAYSILEDDLDLFYFADVYRGVSFHYHQIGLLSYRDRADTRVFAEKLCAVEAGYLDRFQRRKPSFDQKLNFDANRQTPPRCRRCRLGPARLSANRPPSQMRARNPLPCEAAPRNPGSDETRARAVR